MTSFKILMPAIAINTATIKPAYPSILNAVNLLITILTKTRLVEIQSDKLSMAEAFNKSEFILFAVIL